MDVVAANKKCQKRAGTQRAASAGPSTKKPPEPFDSGASSGSGERYARVFTLPVSLPLPISGHVEVIAA